MHYGIKSITQKRGVLINSFWLLGLINVSEFSEVKQRVAALTQTQIKANWWECNNQWIHLVTFVGWQCIEKSGSNSSLSTHYIIIDGSCLGLGHLFFFLSLSLICNKRWQNAGWRFILQPRQQQRHSQLCLVSLLIIIPSSNLWSDTFDNIMWNRSEGSANETEWRMLLAIALTLLGIVAGHIFTHM